MSSLAVILLAVWFALTLGACVEEKRTTVIPAPSTSAVPAPSTTGDKW